MVVFKASNGLFFKEGALIGEAITDRVIKDGLTYFETCRDLLISKIGSKTSSSKKSRSWSKVR